MKEIQQANNISYSSRLWNYGKQALKGVTVMGLGMLGYVGLRGYWNNDSSNSTTKSENADLVLTKEKSSVLLDQPQGNSVTSSVSARRNNLWTSSASEQSIGYRHKRGVVPVNQEFQVSSNSNGASVAITGLPNSDFVITWVGADSNVYARCFDNNRTALGNEFQVSMNNTAYAGSSPAIAGFSNGEFVITWFANGIYAQRFSANGTRLWTEFRLDENTASVSPSMSPAITALINEEFVITWGGGPNILSRYDVYARRFASNGTKLGNEIQVNTNVLLGLYQVDLSSVIANLANGGFVISWISGTPKANVYAQRFSADGTKLGTEFQVNNDNTVETVSRPSITSLANNDFVIAWTASDIHECYAQQIAGNGTMLRTQFPVGSNVGYPNIARLVNNDYVISWHTDIAVYAQRFSSNSETIGSNFQVYSAAFSTGRIAGLPNGDFVIAWSPGSSVYARLFTIIYNTSQLQYNQLQIDQGATVTLNSNQLLVLSDTVATSQLGILVSDVNRGRFSRLNNPDIAVFNFTQYEINNGQIQFTHDDSYNAPSYQIAVFDGFNTTNPQSVVVDFDQKPKWVTQQITVYNRGELQLNAEQWLATDDKSNDQVFFELQNVTHGKYSAVSDIFAIPISNFTQAQVNATQIRFIHDGSNIAPSCSVRVSDGRLYVTYQPCQFNFIANRAPQLTINRLSLVKGEQKVVDSTSIAATDPDESTASELGHLLFNFTAIQHGQFSLSTNPTAVISSAYQSQVAAGQLLFQHDGSENSPSYNVTVSDGFVSTESQAANISFSLTSNPQSQIIRDNTNAAIGGAIGGVGGAVLLAGIGIFGAYRYRRSQQLADQRSNYPLANALYHELNIAGTEDFQSEKGINFINAVDSLNNELIRAGVDIKQMVPEEIDDLAHKLANATKAQLGKKINLLDIQDYAQSIVTIAMTLSGKNRAEDMGVELDEVRTQSNKSKVLYAAVNRFLQKNNINLDRLSPNEIEALVEPLLSSPQGPHLNV